jgi:hypothetical protein
MVGGEQSNGWDCPDASEASLVVYTEAERADWVGRSHKVVEHRGRYWCATRPGVFEPIHLLARLSREEAEKPTPLCWAYRAALKDEDSTSANGFVPVHLVEDVNSYDIGSLAPNKRNELKKSRRLIQFVHVTSPAVLRKFGWRVLLSAASRVPISTPKSEEEYWKWAEGATANKRTVIIAGLCNGELAGYMTAYAVEDTGYIDSLIVHSEFLSTCVSTGLYWEVMRVFKSLDGIRQATSSVHMAEDRGLCAYKAHIGFPVVNIPARFFVASPMKQALKAARPGTFYRFTGLMPAKLAR